MTRTPRPSRGAALLTAMIIVTLIATLASGMVWQQWRAVQVEVAERSQAQAGWILQGALDWARLILREDARSSDIDHLGEPWAVPLAEAKLSTFLAADRTADTDDAPDAFLSGTIRDAQARYNLRNLVKDGKVVPLELQTLQRLCAQLGLADAVAGQLAEALRRATPTSSAVVGVAGAEGEAAGVMPVLPQSTDDLGWLGLDATVVRRLQPLVSWLPGYTPVNLNTASKEVIAAVVPGVHLRTVEDARATLGADAGLDTSRMSVNTRYFEVDGTMRLEQLVVAQRSLLERNVQTREVRVLRSVRIAAPVTAPTSLQQ
jgi:general secretion pathway protein K